MMFRGEGTVALKDGGVLTLALTHRALLFAERAYGKPLAQLVKDMGEGFAGAILAMLRGALLKHHPTIGEEHAEELLFGNSEEIIAALKAAFANAMPDADTSDEGEEGNAPSRQAGKRSGGGGAKRGSTRKASGKKPRAATS